MSLWDDLFAGGSNPPAKSLMPARVVNLLTNPFAVIGQQANLQRDVYVFGDGSPFPLVGGLPTWIYTEFNTLGALKTARSRLQLPDNFTLLTYVGSASVNTKGGFRVNVYDANRRLRLTERPVNFQALAGTGSSPLFQGADIGSRHGYPYQFQQDNAQAIITAVNLESSPNVVQFALYGLQGAVMKAAA